MLVQLSIRDIVLIDRLEIKFGSGLSILTGETGAGKSVLLDSLVLALGARGDASLVRHGAEQGQIEAVFDVPLHHPVRQILRDNGLEDDGDIILRRLQSADGRSRVFINDKIAGLAVMRAIGSQLVEIHGQHADRAFADIETHRALLDAFGSLLPQVAVLGRLHQSWKEAVRALAGQRQKMAEAAREAEYLRNSAEELAKLAPQAGEEESLSARRSLMMKAEKIAGDIIEAGELLSGSQSPVPVLSNLVRRLERKSAEAQDLLAPVVQALDKVLQALAEAQDHIETAGRSLDFDPQEMERVEERLFSLRAAARKYAVAVENLPALQAKMAADLRLLEAGEESLQHLENEAEKARSAYDKAAEILSQQRAMAAGQLEQAVQAELPALKLEGAAFLVNRQVDQENRRAEGIDNVEFQVQTNPGTRAGPMMKTASGGELSRFLLALKVVVAEKTSAPTLVFDEIDTGVGGAVADAIGKRLQKLSSRVQVLAITHAPQVAARADAHFLINKAEQPVPNSGKKGRLATQIRLMAVPERQEEIARMLAGEHITDEARAAAEKLLAAK
ncbi:DNA repair protein RecN [Candidatus Tokpelaia sp.]|uniref:DNA repair protein RecN n=1 Tax=Candidatus Tokpelaia sp. TaxID=2233777 RepID=UPI001238977F|nr:DNA repair protein RecN [Candidatus Tokpelaia sp.]KAA6405874.1 DNA repair protein RecN [Candidatus Tokpelaia sp.]